MDLPKWLFVRENDIIIQSKANQLQLCFCFDNSPISKQVSADLGRGTPFNAIYGLMTGASST